MYKLLREILKELKEINEALKIIILPTYHEQPQWLKESLEEQREARKKAYQEWKKRNQTK